MPLCTHDRILTVNQSQVESTTVATMHTDREQAVVVALLSLIDRRCCRRYSCCATLCVRRTHMAQNLLSDSTATDHTHTSLSVRSARRALDSASEFNPPHHRTASHRIGATL